MVDETYKIPSAIWCKIYTIKFLKQLLLVQQYMFASLLTAVLCYKYLNLASCFMHEVLIVLSWTLNILCCYVVECLLMQIMQDFKRF